MAAQKRCGRLLHRGISTAKLSGRATCGVSRAGARLSPSPAARPGRAGGRGDGKQLVEAQRTFPTLVNRIGILLGIAVAFVLGLFGTIYLSLRSPEVKVPAVVGKNYLEAETALEQAGLKARKRASRYSADSKPDTVLDQTPQAGDVVKTGSPVAVVTSRAEQKEGESSVSITGSDANKATQSATTNKNENPNANANTGASNANANANKPKRNKNTNRNANANQNSNTNTNSNAVVNSNLDNRITLNRNGNDAGTRNRNANARPEANTNTPRNVNTPANTNANRNTNTNANRSANANRAVSNRNTNGRNTNAAPPRNANTGRTTNGNANRRPPLD